jgi:hypothetical protein
MPLQPAPQERVFVDRKRMPGGKWQAEPIAGEEPHAVESTAAAAARRRCRAGGHLDAAFNCRAVAKDPEMPSLFQRR